MQSREKRSGLTLFHKIFVTQQQLIVDDMR